ncbi:MAG: endonuclease IV, partial [Candidatus Thermoplasmatota archaeon]|nr:endonuclease IV [Candidatus Thermoplasmatota archaeon]
MTIRFGPAGIPLSCKGRTLKDGIEDIHALQLDAMEVQLLRPLRDIPEELDLIKELGEELDVSMSIHAPY